MFLVIFHSSILFEDILYLKKKINVSLVHFCLGKYNFSFNTFEHLVFWRKVMFHSLLIFVLVNTVSTSKLFEHTHILKNINVFSCFHFLILFEHTSYFCYHSLNYLTTSLLWKAKLAEFILKINIWNTSFYLNLPITL